MPRSLLGAMVVLAICLLASTVDARDQVEYGRYLGVRLQLWEESYEVLDKLIDNGSADEKSRARRSKAEVMKAEADAIYAEDQDDTGRAQRYEKAVEVFGTPTAERDILAKCEMMLDLAMGMRRSNETKAREYCDEVKTLLDAQRQALEAKRNAMGNAFSTMADIFNATYFRLCQSFYVKGMTYEAGSGERIANFREASKWLDEFDFQREGTTLEFVLTYELRGDMELANGNTAGAVSKYLDLVSFINDFGANSETGRVALSRGYLRAVELMTTELDYDPANLRKVIDLYAEAFTKYGSISDLAFYIKRFQLYRISALIKLGDAEKIKGAIDLLFQLANDRDITFRRQALTVLADIATRNDLDNELRFRCADTVYKGIETSPVLSLILKNIQAYQSMLVACKDVKTFETYAPACFTRIGGLYHGMFRFLDAALVYKEASYRTAYFKDKFAADGAVPEHMKGRCEIITDGKTLNGFPGEMANQFARNAGFLIHKDYGDPKNKYFQDLSKAADLLKASFAGDQAKMDLAYKTAKAMYDKKQYHPAAVRLVNLPANYKGYKLALYIGAKCYYNVSEEATAQRNNRRGESNAADFLWDIEDPDWYAKQIARHATDLAGLPEGLYAGVEKAHWDAILDSKTPDQYVNWHKAAYYYKKYFLFEVMKAWDEVEPLLADIEKPSLADALGALVQARNAQWLRDNPSGSGEPDPDMKRIGYAVYDLAFLLRNPPKGDNALRDAVLNQERDLALALLRPYWKWFGPHLAGSENYKQGALRLSFGALTDRTLPTEAKDEEAVESVYRAYIENFPADETYIKWAVAVVYRVLLDKLGPKTAAMAVASSKLMSYSNLLKKYAFERINGAAVDPETKQPLPGFAEDAKRLEAAKGSHERRVILAEHFWKRWMLEQFLDAPKYEHVRANLPDLRETLRQKWDEMAETYPKRWADAVRAEYDLQIKKDNFKPIRDELNKTIASGSNYEIIDKIQAAMDAESAKKENSDGKKISMYNDLLMNINVSTEELAYFTGTIFIYEFGDFLEKLNDDVNDRARPTTTRILKYYEESRVRGGEGGPESLNEENVRTLGGQYFRIRDWANTVKYLTNYVERFGGERVWGKEESIPVDQRAKVIGKSTSGAELEIKYQLGRAHLELYKETKNIEDLKKAALYMRRCWCFNLIRDTNKKMNDAFNWARNAKGENELQKAIEDNYIYISNAMAETFLLLHEAGDVKITWPKYINQATKTLDQNKENPLQDVPVDKAGYLWEASQIHLKVWVQFQILGRYQFRSDFRDNLEGWLKLMIRWFETYGKDDKGITALKGEGAKTQLADARNMAATEAGFSATYLPANIVDYLNKLKGYAKRLEELQKK